MIESRRMATGLAAAALWATSAAASVSAQGAEGPPPPPLPERADASAVPLFDGTSLGEFLVIGNGAAFRVEDAKIIGTPVPNRENSYLRTVREDYRDFILELEFRVRGQLNSGVQVRSESETPDGERTRVVGYQVEIDPSERAWTGGIFDEGRRGWLVKLDDNEPARQAFKSDDWNHLKITCRGDVIETRLNGVSAASLRDNLTRAGFIALQIRSTLTTESSAQKSADPPQIQWRHLTLKELPAQE